MLPYPDLNQSLGWHRGSCTICEGDSSMVVLGPRDLLHAWLFRRKVDSPCPNFSCLILHSGVMGAAGGTGGGLSASRASPAHMFAKPAWESSNSEGSILMTGSGRMLLYIVSAKCTCWNEYEKLPRAKPFRWQRGHLSHMGVDHFSCSC